MGISDYIIIAGVGCLVAAYFKKPKQTKKLEKDNDSIDG